MSSAKGSSEEPFPLFPRCPWGSSIYDFPPQSRRRETYFSRLLQVPPFPVRKFPTQDLPSHYIAPLQCCEDKSPFFSSLHVMMFAYPGRGGSTQRLIYIIPFLGGEKHNPNTYIVLGKKNIITRRIFEKIKKPWMILF